MDDLIERWSKVKKDPKLIEFAKQIQDEFLNQTRMLVAN